MRRFAAVCWLWSIALFAVSCGADAPGPPPSSTGAATALTGAVTDAETGEPVGGASLRLVQGDVRAGQSDPDAEFELSATLSDAAGAYAVTGVEPNVTASLLVTAQGYAPQGKTFASGFEPGVTTTADFALRPAGTVLGVFVDADGAPVVGGMVLVSRTGEGAQPGGSTARTRPDGSFRVDALDLGATYGAAGSAPDGGVSAPVRDLRPTRDQPEVRIELRLAGAGTIVLKVRDDTGAPVPSQMARRGTFSPVFAVANETGDLVFADVPPGRVPIAVGGDEHVRSTFLVTVAAGQTVERDVVLERGAAIEGVVRNDLGEPIEGAEVSADRPPLPAFDGLAASTASTETDEEGRFRLTGLRRGPHMLEVWAEDHNRMEIPRLEAPGEGLEIELPRTGAVVVNLMVETDEDASIHAEYLQLGGAAPASTTRYDGGEYPLEPGPLELVGVPAGDVEIRLFVPGRGMTTREVTVAPGETVVLGDLPLKNGFPVHGRVVDARGKPIPNAEIHNTGWAYALAEPVVTDAQGRFTLEDLSEHAWPLMIHADGFVSARHVLIAKRGLDPIEITLEQGGVLKVRLATPTGDPAVGIPIRVTPLRESAHPADRVSLRTDRGGIALLRRPAGRYALTFGTEKRVITLEEGQETDVRAVVD